MAIYSGEPPAANFAMVPNHWFRDPRLSGKAKGYMGYIATHAVGYRLTIVQMVAEMAEGRDAVYAGLAELVEHGYLLRVQQRGDGNQFGDVDYHFGPAAYEQQYERAWGAKADVSAGETASGFSGHGEPVYGSPGHGEPAAKKTNSQKTSPKNTNLKEDQSSPRASSSSSSKPVRKPRSEEDEEARAKQIDDQAINARDQKQHRAAVRAIVRRLGTDAECAEATIARLHELVEESERQPIGDIERYVRRIPDDQLAGHLEEATWEIEAERAAEHSRAEAADGIMRQVAKSYPDADLTDLRAAYIGALRQGHTGDAICAALNATIDQRHRGDPIDDYIDAIEALGQPVAA